MFESLFGAEMPLAIRFFLAFLIVLGLIGATAWAVRRFGSGRGHLDRVAGEPAQIGFGHLAAPRVVPANEEHQRLKQRRSIPRLPVRASRKTPSRRRRRFRCSLRTA